MSRFLREAVAFIVVGALWLVPCIWVGMAALLLLSRCRG